MNKTEKFTLKLMEKYNLIDLSIMRKECEWVFQDMENTIYSKEDQEMWDFRLTCINKAIEEKIEYNFRQINM